MHKLNFLHIKRIKKAVFLFLFILIFLPKEKAFSSPICFFSFLFNQTIRTGFLREDFHIRRNLFVEKWSDRFTHSTSNDEIEAFISELYSFNAREIKEIIDIIRKTIGLIEDEYTPILSIPREQIKNVVESPLFLDFLEKNIEDGCLFSPLRYSLMALKWGERKDFMSSSLLLLFVRDLTHFNKDEQEFIMSLTGIRIDQIIENRFRELKDSPSETFELLNLTQSFIENEKLAFDIIKKLFFLKWQITVSLLESDNPNVFDTDKLEASLRDLSRSFSFLDIRTQVFLTEEIAENQTSNQVQKLVKNPSTSNPIQSFIKNKGLRFDIRERFFFLKWRTISLFKEDSPNVLDPDKLEAFLGDLNHFDVETQAFLIKRVSNKWTPEQVRELMKNPSISNLIQNSIENTKIAPDVRKSLFFLKWKTISLFKEDDPNVLDPDNFKAFLRDLNFFDVENQAFLIKGVSNKWTPKQVQELMKNLLFSNLIQSFIENKKLGFFIRKDIFFLKWEAIPLFKEDDSNVFDPNKIEAFLRDLSFFDVENQASLIIFVSNKWNWTQEQTQKLMDLSGINQGQPLK